MNLDEITWVCHVCLDERPDRFISVHKTEIAHPLPGYPDYSFSQNVRFCNDRPACVGGAPAVTFFPDSEAG